MRCGMWPAQDRVVGAPAAGCRIGWVAVSVCWSCFISAVSVGTRTHGRTSNNHLWCWRERTNVIECASAGTSSSKEKFPQRHLGEFVSAPRAACIQGQRTILCTFFRAHHIACMRVSIFNIRILGIQVHLTGCIESHSRRDKAIGRSDKGLLVPLPLHLP